MLVGGRSLYNAGVGRGEARLRWPENIARENEYIEARHTRHTTQVDGDSIADRRRTSAASTLMSSVWMPLANSPMCCPTFGMQIDSDLCVSVCVHGMHAPTTRMHASPCFRYSSILITPAVFIIPLSECCLPSPAVS